MRKTSKRLSIVLLGTSHPSHPQGNNWQLDSSSWEFLGTGDKEQEASPTVADENEDDTSSSPKNPVGAPSPYENMFNSDCLSAIEVSVHEDSSDDSGSAVLDQDDQEKADDEATTTKAEDNPPSCSLHNQAPAEPGDVASFHSESKGKKYANTAIY